jgi:tape measure domain-containing protein
LARLYDGRTRSTRGIYEESKTQVMSDLRINIIGNDKTKKAFKSVKENVSNVEKSLFSLKNILITVAGSMVIRQFGKLSNEFQNLQNRLKLVTSSTRELNAVQEELFQISRRTRGGFSETVELYQKLALQSQNLGLKNKELLQITENVNKVIGISGVNSIQASSGILQLSQAFASGRLQGDEFRSISENIPPLLDIFAKELGITRGELKKFGSEGKITSEVIATSLLKETDNINKQFQNIAPTLGSASTRIRNSFLTLVGTFNEVTGVANTLAASLMGISNNLDSLTDKMRDATPKVSDLRKELEELNESGINLGGLALKDPIGIFQSELVSQTNEEIKKAINILDVYRDRIQLIANGQITILEKTKETNETNIKAIKKQKQEIKNIHEAYLSHKKEVEVTNHLHIEIYEKLKEQNKQFSLSNEIFSMMTSEVSSFSRGIAESIVLGKELTASFKALAQQILVNIISKTIERLALLGIEKLLLGEIVNKEAEKDNLIRKQNTNLKRQIALNAMTGGGGSFLSGLFGGKASGGRASGGSVQKGKPYMVGERGAELFVPNQSGQIQQSARGGNGGSTTVNFNINTVDASGFEELLVRSRGTITQLINSAVNERGSKNLI